MNYPILKGAAYALVHANDFLLHLGTTQTGERLTNPSSEFLTKLPNHLRSFSDVVAYPPNQAVIGGIEARALDSLQKPWYSNPLPNAARVGKHGEIIPQDEFIGIIKACDAFDLVLLTEEFSSKIHEVLASHPVFGSWSSLAKITKNPASIDDINAQISEHDGAGLYHEGVLVGVIKKAHAFDQALTSHVIVENLVSKASGAIALGLLLHQCKLSADQFDYIIECSEEACGDMNQRGGGNFAKAIGEVCGLTNATGSDTRGFCAAPVHALVQAAALVKSGVYKNVAVVAGGSSAKLGMNARDHVKKGLPALEDVIGAFAVHISENDGISPIIRTDIIGRHTIGSGSSPQAVTQAIVADPLERMGLGIKDVDTFAVEMQNPEVTESAGAGNVPLANYKMIAALGVMRKEVERAELNDFVEKIAIPGFAPTQGHIPSGVPLLGYFRDAILDGKLSRTMVIGKGSLFLGRLTNLFDGVSFILEKNIPQTAQTDAAPSPQKRVRVGITTLGSEHGTDEVLAGAVLAVQSNPGVQVVAIGQGTGDGVESVAAKDEAEAHKIMDAMLADGRLDAAVTMHYNFPIGVTTIGRCQAPGRGKNTFIASTTGTSDTERVSALVKNAIYGIALAKACGNASPTVGILNIDGARAAERVLNQLSAGGYGINFSASERADGGAILRGNDILTAAADIVVMDSLTGNVVTKMLSAFTSGGGIETVGDGYGPGVGAGFSKVVGIVSRASGANVIAGAIALMAECAGGGLAKHVRDELSSAKRAGLDALLAGLQASKKEQPTSDEIKPPPEKVVTEEIPGIEVFDLEDAAKLLWKHGIYATTGMGCTGPVVLVAPEDFDSAKRELSQGGYL